MIKKILITIILAGLIPACSTHLTTSACKESTTKLPKKWYGIYRFVSFSQLPGIDQEGSFDEVYMKINGPTVSEVFIDSNGRDLIKNSPTLRSSISFRVKPGGSKNYFDNLCKTSDGSYINQSMNRDGTYSLTEIYENKYGLAFEGIIFLVNDIKKYKLPYFLVPDVPELGLQADGTQNRWSNSPKIVLDNSKLDLESLMKYRTRGSMIMQLEKVHEKSQEEMKWIPLNNI